MEFLSGHTMREADISGLFRATFSASEGVDEGKIIGELVDDLMQTTPPQDLFVFSALDDKGLAGCIIFSRLTFEQDERVVFLLSPVAVKTDRQKMGIGQKLIAHGLETLRQQGVDLAFTYGDPDYYSKSGFRQITEDYAKAPSKLAQPQGWLAQSLTGKDHGPLAGPSCCVAALNKPELW